MILWSTHPLKWEMLDECNRSFTMNTPVLATSFKNLDNIIKDGENGYLLKTQDVGDLCEKIILLKQNPINNTRSTIPINFTLDAMVRDTIMTYKSLMESSLRKSGDDELCKKSRFAISKHHWDW